MLSNTTLLCPRDGVSINQTTVRVVAGLVLLTAVVYVLTDWVALPLLLVVDFGLRSFNQRRYSPFRTVAGWLVSTFGLPYKATDQAPKRFAARIGLGFSVLISTLHLVGISVWIPAAVLLVFAGLESMVGFCAGCLVYTFFVRRFPRTA